MAMTVLTIYTMTHCPTCAETRRTATAIARRLPEIRVELINIDEDDVPVPSTVFSVPTYILNGAVIALGNPYLDQLEQTIRRYLDG